MNGKDDEINIKSSDIKYMIGQMMGEIKGSRRDIQEMKKKIDGMVDWQKSVEQRLKEHEIEIKHLHEKDITFKDTSPSLKITITAGGLMGLIGIIISILIHGGVNI